VDSVNQLLRAWPPTNRPFWLTAVGAKIAASELTEQRMITLARKCILHAFAVNQKYFAARVSAEALALVEQIEAAIEDVSNVTEFPPGDIVEMTYRVMPEPDSPDETVPGWVALLDAVGQFVDHRNDRNLDSLFWAISGAYQSVANRACAEFHGVEGNCGFMHDQKETEQNNELCAREIEYQLEQLARHCDAE
jgi:hypothetical protein